MSLNLNGRFYEYPHINIVKESLIESIESNGNDCEIDLYVMLYQMHYRFEDEDLQLWKLIRYIKNIRKNPYSRLISKEHDKIAHGRVRRYFKLDYEIETF